LNLQAAEKLQNRLLLFEFIKMNNKARSTKFTKLNEITRTNLVLILCRFVDRALGSFFSKLLVDLSENLVGGSRLGLARAGQHFRARQSTEEMSSKSLPGTIR